MGRLFSDDHVEEVVMLKDTFRAQAEEMVVDMFVSGASGGLEMAGAQAMHGFRRVHTH